MGDKFHLILEILVGSDIGKLREPVWLRKDLMG